MNCCSLQIQRWDYSLRRQRWGGGLEEISLRTESLALGIFQTLFGNKLTPLTCGSAIRETSVKSQLIMQTPQGEFPKGILKLEHGLTESCGNASILYFRNPASIHRMQTGVTDEENQSIMVLCIHCHHWWHTRLSHTASPLIFTALMTVTETPKGRLSLFLCYCLGSVSTLHWFYQLSHWQPCP